MPWARQRSRRKISLLRHDLDLLPCALLLVHTFPFQSSSGCGFLLPLSPLDIYAMAAISSLRVVRPQIDLTSATSSSPYAGSVGEKAFFRIHSRKQLLGAASADAVEKACPAAANGIARAAVSSSRIAKGAPKSCAKSNKPELVSETGAGCWVDWTDLICIGDFEAFCRCAAIACVDGVGLLVSDQG